MNSCFISPRNLNTINKHSIWIINLNAIDLTIIRHAFNIEPIFFHTEGIGQVFNRHREIFYNKSIKTFNQNDGMVSTICVVVIWIPRSSQLNQVSTNIRRSCTITKEGRNIWQAGINLNLIEGTILLVDWKKGTFPLFSIPANIRHQAITWNRQSSIFFRSNMSCIGNTCQTSFSNRISNPITKGSKLIVINSRLVTRHIDDTG